MELCARKDVPVEQTWDLSLIFPDEKSMWESLEKIKADVKRFVETYAEALGRVVRRAEHGAESGNLE